VRTTAACATGRRKARTIDENSMARRVFLGKANEGAERESGWLDSAWDRKESHTLRAVKKCQPTAFQESCRWVHTQLGGICNTENDLWKRPELSDSRSRMTRNKSELLGHKQRLTCECLFKSLAGKQTF